MPNYALVLAGVCLLSAPAGAVAPHRPAFAIAAQDAKAAPRKEAKISPKVLTAYVGEYQMGPDRVLTLTLENGSLWGQPTEQQKRQLFAESDTKFFLKDLDVQITFQKDAKGKVIGMVMDQAGRPQRELKKIK